MGEVFCPDGLNCSTGNCLNGDCDRFPKEEWKSLSSWLREQKKGLTRTPQDDGWELVGGALRRVRNQQLLKKETDRED